MDIEKFKRDFKSPRTKIIIDVTTKKKDFVDFNELVNTLSKDAIKRNTTKKNYKGYPSRSIKSIMYLIKIGFLLIDKDKGVKFNEDFIPLNQK